MGILDGLRRQLGVKATLAHQSQVVAELTSTPETAIRAAQNSAILKSPSPTYLVRPPFGIPLNKNVVAIRNLARNAYVFSAEQTIADEIAAAEWEITQKEGFNVSDVDLQRVHTFFENPNGNDESFNDILRQLVPDILELDAGVIVKSFSFEKYVSHSTPAGTGKLTGGALQQIFAKDGGSFLLNPDFYGYFGNRSDFIAPLYASGDVPQLVRDQLNQALMGNLPTFGNLSEQYPALYQLYSQKFMPQAAYFQYPTVNAQLPVPFGKREIIYIKRNPRTHQHYGYGAIEMITDIIFTLVYGSKYNLDFYLNNNMPDGVVEMLSANKNDMLAFREQFQKEFRATDTFGNIRKFFFKTPIVSTPFKFIPFNLPPEQMDIIGQQTWFIKLLWACMGVNADEMGFTEDSNRATGHAQASAVKRKVINPMLRKLQYHVNMQIIPEFGVPGIELKFRDYDLTDEHSKVDLYAKEVALGIRSKRDVAEERGIDYDKQLADMEADGDIPEPEPELTPEQLTMAPMAASDSTPQQGGPDEGKQPAGFQASHLEPKGVPQGWPAEPYYPPLTRAKGRVARHGARHGALRQLTGAALGAPGTTKARHGEDLAAIARGFATERAEHPEFNDSDVLKIVRDHLAEDFAYYDAPESKAALDEETQAQLDMMGLVRYNKRFKELDEDIQKAWIRDATTFPKSIAEGKAATGQSDDLIVLNKVFREWEKELLKFLDDGEAGKNATEKPVTP